MRQYRDDGTHYAMLVASGEIVASKKVIKACQRHLDDLQKKDFDYVYLPEKAEVAVQFMELLPDIKTGEPLPLADFQKFVVYSLFGWYRKDNTELRRFNKAMISMARENGKSALISSLAIYSFLADKNPSQNRQIYCTAQNREQANIVFKMIVQRLDGLMAKSKGIRNVIRKVRNEINLLTDYSVIRPLSKETSNINGLSPTVAILDEYGASKDNEMMEVLQSGMMTQPNGLTIIISTAYFNLNSPMYSQEYKYCERILNGEVENDNYFALIFEQDSDEEYLDEKLWIKSNPLLEVESIRETLLRNLRARVKQATDNNDLLGLIVKNFNRWVQANKDSFLPEKEWNKCKVDPIDKHGRQVYFGLDLSRRGDLTACSSIYPLSDGKFYVDNHSFVATTGGLEAKSQRDKIDYQLLIDKGYATASELRSGFIDYEQVVDYMIDEITTNNLDVQAICYDRTMIEHLLPIWEKKTKGTSLFDIPFIEVAQNYMSVSQPIKEFQFKVYECKIQHSNNPNLNLAINNAVLKYDNNNNVILDKMKAREKIDPLVALIIGWVEAMHHEYKDNNKGITEEYILSEDFGF